MYLSARIHPRQPSHALLNRVRRDSRVTDLLLAPLDLRQTRSQLEHLLGHRVPSELVSRLHERSEGNPYFTELLAVTTAGDETLPRELQDLLLEPVSTLPTDARNLLQVVLAGPRTSHRGTPHAAQMRNGRRGASGTGGHAGGTAAAQVGRRTLLANSRAARGGGYRCHSSGATPHAHAALAAALEDLAAGEPLTGRANRRARRPRWGLAAEPGVEPSCRH